MAGLDARETARACVAWTPVLVALTYAAWTMATPSLPVTDSERNATDDDPRYDVILVMAATALAVRAITTWCTRPTIAPHVAAHIAARKRRAIAKAIADAATTAIVAAATTAGVDVPPPLIDSIRKSIAIAFHVTTRTPATATGTATGMATTTGTTTTKPDASTDTTTANTGSETSTSAGTDDTQSESATPKAKRKRHRKSRKGKTSGGATAQTTGTTTTTQTGGNTSTAKSPKTPSKTPPSKPSPLAKAATQKPKAKTDQPKRTTPKSPTRTPYTPPLPKRTPPTPSPSPSLTPAPASMSNGNSGNVTINVNPSINVSQGGRPDNRGGPRTPLPKANTTPYQPSKILQRGEVKPSPPTSVDRDDSCGGYAETGSEGGSDLSELLTPRSTSTPPKAKGKKVETRKKKTPSMFKVSAGKIVPEASKRGPPSAFVKGIKTLTAADGPLAGKSVVSGVGTLLQCMLSCFCIQMTGTHSDETVKQMSATLDAATTAIGNLSDELAAALHAGTGIFFAEKPTTSAPRMREGSDALVALAILFHSKLSLNVWGLTSTCTAEGKPFGTPKNPAMGRAMHVKGTTSTTFDVVLHDEHYSALVNGVVSDDGTLTISGTSALHIPTPAEATATVNALANALAASAKAAGSDSETEASDGSTTSVSGRSTASSDSSDDSSDGDDDSSLPAAARRTTQARARRGGATSTKPAAAKVSFADATRRRSTRTKVATARAEAAEAAGASGSDATQ